MSMHNPRHRVAIAAVFAGLLACAAVAAGAPISLTLDNLTQVRIEAVYVARTAERHGAWGPNQLDGPIQPDAAFELGNMPCATYDIQVVTSDGRSCVRDDYSVCHEAILEITDAWLASHCR